MDTALDCLNGLVLNWRHPHRGGLTFSADNPRSRAAAQNCPTTQPHCLRLLACLRAPVDPVRALFLHFSTHTGTAEKLESPSLRQSCRTDE
jgi:hypothetical protein